MTANDELRRMLDERGVEWDYGITGPTTTRFRVNGVNGVDLTFTPMRDGLLCSTILTPEQVIDATLGSCNCSNSERTGTCHNISEVMDEHGCGGGRMSITDELRDWAHEHLYKSGIRSDLLAIADRIDAVNEEAIQQALMGNGSVPATDENMAVYGWVRLPKDADGEYIHVGDVMERGNARGHVIALMLSEYPKKWGGGLHWGVQLEGEHAPTALDLTFHHYHEPTVEDVLLDLLEESSDPTCDATPTELAEKYAAKLRLAESEDA